MSRAGHIVVLGEALVDVFPDRQELGGAPFNVARNLAALGAAPLLVSRVGLDSAGDQIAAQMSRLGMDARGVQLDPGRATGRVLVGLQAGQPDFRIEADGAWDWVDPSGAMSVVQSAAPTWMYFGTLAQRGSITRKAIQSALAASTAPRFLDLNLRDMPGQREVAEQSLHLADQLKVNEDELETLLSWFAPGAVAGTGEAEFSLLARFDLRRMVITRGERGWSCYDLESRRVLDGPAPKVHVRDTVGAGDAFSAVVLLGEQRGWSLETTLKRAAHFSAAVCTLNGAFDEQAAIYREALESWSD